MALSIVHNKVATLPDEAGAEVNKAEWNDTHGVTGTVAAADVTGLATVATSGLYSDLSGSPTTGSGSGFAPTVSAATNTTGTPTMSAVKHLRVGNTVTMSGQFTVTPTLTATVTSFEFTLPVASNIGAASDISGSAFCGAIAGMGAEILGVVANDTAKVRWVSTDITAQTWSWSAQYVVI